MDFKALLRQRNLKATPTRMGVLQLIYDYTGAIPFADIQKGMPGADRITMYRTMNALKDHGLIHEAMRRDDQVYYALCDHHCEDHAHHDHDHIHFQCTSCKTVNCIPLPKPIKIAVEGHQIESLQVQATGVCAQCV